MNHQARISFFLLGVVVLIGCTRAPDASLTIAAPPPGSASKALSFALEGQPERFIMAGLGGSVAGGSAGNAGNTLELALHRHLAGYDERGNLLPELARELPAQANGTWIVRPDGTMQTTYRIRQDVKWHDGTALTARDFVFAFSVTNDPALPVARRTVASQIAHIDALDDFTLAIEWRRTYPFANAIIDQDLGPLPRHLLEAELNADKDRFQFLPYWGHEFVGVGPYQLSEWELGSYMILRANSSFYGQRPKIDSIKVHFIENEPTVAASLLSGVVDGSIPRAVEFSQASFVAQEWQSAGRSPIFIAQATHWRFIEVQFQDPRPRELADVRVRRGLLHGIDRQALSEALFAGRSPIAHAYMPPQDKKWDWVRDVAIQYEYDPRRASGLLAEAGWTRRSDGSLGGPTGERVTIPVWTRGSQQDLQELAIIADFWKAVGIEAEQVVLTRGQAADNQFLATYPAMGTNMLPASDEWGFNLTHSAQCPTEQKRWVGRNRGCYSNGAMDDLVGRLQSAIDPTEQQRLSRDLIRLQTEELAVLPLNYNLQVLLFRDGVTGVKGDTYPRSSPLWNVEQWDTQ